jgi:hypothetical protein
VARAIKRQREDEEDVPSQRREPTHNAGICSREMPICRHNANRINSVNG